jgi:HK97 family phage prohead protease
MHPFQRRLLGNRVYWRDVDVDRIAKHFDLTSKQVSELPLLREADAAPLLEQKEASLVEDAGGERFKFILSSNSVDSYGDTINQNTWDYSRAQRNFPTLAFHDSQALPLGKWVSYALEGGMLKGVTAFSDRSYARDVAKEIKAGNIVAASVGFMPGEWEWSQDPKRKMGIDFKAGHVLLEASIVAIGANPDAILEHAYSAQKFVSVPQAKWDALQALPNELRSVSAKLPPAAKSVAGAYKRAANTIERVLGGSVPAPEPDTQQPAGTPALDAARRRMAAIRARLT